MLLGSWGKGEEEGYNCGVGHIGKIGVIPIPP